MSNSASIFSTLGPLLGVILVYFIVIRVFFLTGGRNGFVVAFLRSSTPTGVVGVVLFIAVYLESLVLCVQFSVDAREFAYNAASATFGMAVGWVLGMVLSPHTEAEATQSSLLTKAISTFFTGYLLGYLKDVKLADIAAILTRPGMPFRLMIGTACFLPALAAVFALRWADINHEGTAREWFIKYWPADKPHAQALAGDILARGPFPSREDAFAEIERIKGQDQFRGYSLTAVRIDIASDEAPAPDAGDTATPPKSSITTTHASAAAGPATADAATTLPDNAEATTRSAALDSAAGGSPTGGP